MWLIGEHPLSVEHGSLIPNLAVSINGSLEPFQVVGIGSRNTGGFISIVCWHKNSGLMHTDFKGFAFC